MIVYYWPGKNIVPGHKFAMQLTLIGPSNQQSEVCIRQGSKWLMAKLAEKRGRGSKRTSMRGFGGPQKPPVGSKGRAFGGGPTVLVICNGVRKLFSGQENSRFRTLNHSPPIFIDREAREIMYLVASVRLSVCPSVCPSALSRLNRFP